MHSKSSEIQRRLIDRLLAEYAKAGIQYCILRNYERLPEDINAKDIDLVILKSDCALIRLIMAKVAKELEMDVIELNQHQYVECFLFLKRGTHDYYSLKVDYFFEFDWKGATLLTSEEILGNRWSYRNFYVIDPVQEAVMAWLKPLITGAFIKESYREKIISTAQERQKEFRDCVRYILGDSLTNILMPLIIKVDLDATLKYRRRITGTAWVRSFIREPFLVTKNVLQHYFVEFKRQILSPKKNMIVVIGPDGTGKSTIIEQLAEYIPELFKEDKNKVKVFHFRPNLFPNLKRLMTLGTSKETEEEFTKPHRAEPSGFLLSLFRLFYYAVDYTLGYLIKIRPLFGKGYLVIFDRYFYDFIIDPARSRVKLPKFIPMFLTKFVPKPTLVVYLDNDVETILARKRELPPDELSRQLQEYRKLVAIFPWFYKVDSRRPVEDIVREISIEYIKRIARPVNEVFKDK